MDINLNWGGLYTSFEGIQYLMDLYNKIMLSQDSVIRIEMSRVLWIDANMCAPLGALLHSTFCLPKNRQKEIFLLNMNPNVEVILRKNGFLPDICLREPKKLDIFKTTIEYKRFGSIDSVLFKEYVENHFIKKHMGNHIPQMDLILLRKFRESIFEIFANAVAHSETKQGIFACGQYFPKKEQLKFSIADLGIGIRKNIYKHLKRDYTPERAISWAVDGENTTRQLEGGIPGGIGLKLIKNFIYVNGGTMTIISDGGYWRFNNGKERLERLMSPFPGTVVNITINTSGKAEILQQAEVTPENIF
jgi:hypothetical protein